jgi:23S rRNA (cytidine1920-2'-O)/16S rRNA (cytidine1409-2'-O)-methyltransferase
MAQRADLLLVERGFFESRAKARAAIEAGLVKVDGIALKTAASHQKMAHGAVNVAR